MKVIEIQSNWNGALLYSGKHTNVREAAEAAVKAGADLRGADLRGADLRDADLARANLRDAYLSGANLARANLRDAYLSGANLRDADLSDANLRDAYLAHANLNGANLRGADLRDANLSGADLRDAYLVGADLRGADLRGANMVDAYLIGAKVGNGADVARLVGSRPIVQIGPIGSRNDWLLVFWCGDSGMRISTGCQQQISEEYFLERLTESHGAGDDADTHAENYLAALAFAKRLLNAQP